MTYHDPETVSLRALNLKLKNDPRIELILLPLWDEITLIQKQSQV